MENWCNLFGELCQKQFLNRLYQLNIAGYDDDTEALALKLYIL